ncbi:hypothetical protein RQM47_13835 [Rubrivirga sp. S365]|uniref:Uncharacterized protein n=1 Tax=Rubrivirga litoralis TaxID=3075598 RepID=A0ABU3BMU4_9BACT|nr:MULTISPECIES: hypothetical protein [unclassified Rubrivirga]MDT0630560.1 hypothetical protein [Rubrivirga sp. F394]MDT7857728.1 hypothetical protein [Rubrivirga sp. S365]
MGKVSLLLVSAFGIAGATIFFTAKEADVRASATQGVYEADVIAREIARSAYNAGVADVNRHGTDIDQALLDFGTRIESARVPEDEQCANGKPICARRTGEMLDGTYVVEASVDGGNGIDIYAAGTFGYQAGDRPVSKTHKINESHSVNVLQVDPSSTQCSELKIQFVDSRAGYCSAIFLQRTVAGAALPPEMVYAPGNDRNGERNTGYEVLLQPGTQMNFAIGVDDRCGRGGTRPTHHPRLRMASASALLAKKDPTGENPDYGAERLAAEMARYTYRPDDWAWTHWALDGTALRDGDPQEAPWGMVETDPNNRQRWRISFEDIPDWNLGPDDAGYDDPNRSLWATKRFGYDTDGDGKGDGWNDNRKIRIVENGPRGYVVSDVNGPDGFHDLRDTGRPADFSDQVIFVEVTPASKPCDVVATTPGSGRLGGS